LPEETISFVASKGIEIRIERTGKAVELFNSMEKDGITIAALHLTC